MAVEIRHDERRHRFVAEVEGQEAYLRYVRAGDHALHYTSTFVPREHRKQGLGSHLVEHALEHARQQGFDVVARCAFVKRVMNERGRFRPLASGDERSSLLRSHG